MMFYQALIFLISLILHDVIAQSPHSSTDRSATPTKELTTSNTGGTTSTPPDTVTSPASPSPVTTSLPAFSLTALSRTDEIISVTTLPTTTPPRATTPAATAVSPVQTTPSVTVPGTSVTIVYPPIIHTQVTETPEVTVTTPPTANVPAAPTALSSKLTIVSVDLTGLNPSNAPLGPAPAPLMNNPNLPNSGNGVTPSNIGGQAPGPPGGSSNGGSSDGASSNGASSNGGLSNGGSNQGNGPASALTATAAAGALPASVSNGVYYVGSQAITSGAAPVTIDGQAFSIGSNGALEAGGSQTLGSGRDGSLTTFTTGAGGISTALPSFTSITNAKPASRTTGGTSSSGTGARAAQSVGGARLLRCQRIGLLGSGAGAAIALLL